MNLVPPAPPPGAVVYPESDGQPMADNTRQFRWIVALYGNLAALFSDRPDVLVAADLFWYPVEGDPELRAAPDVLVVFGRPKGDRGSYKQWEEEGVPPTVVFEVLYPGRSGAEWLDTLALYEDYGVEEYRLYCPDSNRLYAYLRQGDDLVRIRQTQGLVSPRLGVRFDLSGPELVVYRPDGRRFLSFEELEVEREQERQRAEHRAEEPARRTPSAAQRVVRLVQLRRKARLGQATAAEVEEIERLKAERFPPR